MRSLEKLKLNNKLRKIYRKTQVLYTKTHINLNPNVRTGDAQTGITPIFNPDTAAKLTKDLNAQVAITTQFGQQASRTIGKEMGEKTEQLKKAAKDEKDPEKKAALEAEAKKWDEGGIYRNIAHALVGGLTGGNLQGALGAGAVSGAAPLLEAFETQLQSGLANLGLSDKAATDLSKALTGLTAAGLGAALGGTAGAVTGFNGETNNRQLHPSERELAKRLARQSNGRYTAEQIENAMRNSGNSELGETIATGMVVDPKDGNQAIYDPGAQWMRGENGKLVQVLPNRGVVDADLAAYLKSSTGAANSPYFADTVPAANVGPAKPNVNSRDRLTGLPLDEQGRYQQQIKVGDQMFAPKYHACATVDCIRLGANLDMSDPGTQAYVKAAEAQIFKDIATASNVVTLFSPIGAAKVTSAVSIAAAGGSAATDSNFTDETLKQLSQIGAKKFFETVMLYPPVAAARAISIIDLSGGWDRFVKELKK